MKVFNCLSAVAIITLASFQPIKHNTVVKDYFSIRGPLVFSKVNYNLSWSAHPTGNYYKQEYLLAGEKSESFTKMMIVEAVVGDVALPDIVKAKMNEIDQRKKTDPLANYQVIKNPGTGEYLLDFIIGQSSGKFSVAEWNAYRYTQLTGNGGKKGVVLFAYCKRSYGDAIPGFLKALKTERTADINLLAAYKIPELKIKGE